MSNSILPEATAIKESIANESGDHILRVKHSVNPGDLIACMSNMKKYYDATQRKLIVSQQIGMLAQYYPGAIHPTVNEEDRNVCCNDKMWEMLKPLVESQEYVHSFEKYEGQHVDLDFNVIRGTTFVNLPNGMIQSWIVYAFPDLAYDLTKPWIFLKDENCPLQIKSDVDGKILLNFTERYRNTNLNYYFLKHYMNDLVFAGTEREHYLFCEQWQLQIPRLIVNDFLELGYAIKNCRFILANQSLNWNIAEAMKTPRILEVCSYASNCAPFVGEDSYGYFHQIAAEHYFEILYNKTKSPS